MRAERLFLPFTKVSGVSVADEISFIVDGFAGFGMLIVFCVRICLMRDF